MVAARELDGGHDLLLPTRPNLVTDRVALGGVSMSWLWRAS